MTRMGSTRGQASVELLGSLPLDIKIREQADSGMPTVVAEPGSTDSVKAVRAPSNATKPLPCSGSQWYDT